MLAFFSIVISWSGVQEKGGLRRCCPNILNRSLEVFQRNFIGRSLFRNYKSWAVSQINIMFLGHKKRFSFPSFFGAIFKLGTYIKGPLARKLIAKFSGVDVMITIFCDFFQLFATKWRFYHKPML
jgi:hypothetical protein